MKYKCLVLDHDDTTVNSTATIHYPAFFSYLSKTRPDFNLTLEDYFSYNFDPGFFSFCNDILHFNENEKKEQEQNWLNYVSTHVPFMYEGMKELIEEFKRRGGIVCVVSHSKKENIIRDYIENDCSLPDLIFGWDLPAEQRKPSPYPLKQIMEQFSLNSNELVVVDDLLPGKVMADECNVDFVGVGWSHHISKIESYMRENCLYYCKSVDELKKILFES